MKFDKYDLHILQILQKEGRISNQDLADRVGLSPSPCLRRVRALEDEGVIKGYRAILDAKKMGYPLMALLGVSMDVHTNDRFVNFEQKIAQMHEVVECLLITGQTSDYLLKLQVADMDAYQELLLNRISRITGVKDLHTSFVLRQIKC